MRTWEDWLCISNKIHLDNSWKSLPKWFRKAMLVLRKYHLVWYFVSNSVQLVRKSVRKCPNYSWRQCTCHNVHAIIIQLSSKIRISISSWVSERDASLPSPLFHSPSVLPWQSSLVGQMAFETFFFSFTLICQDFITHLFSTWCIASFGEGKWLDFSMHSAMVNLGDRELCSYPGAVPRPCLPICHRSLARESHRDRLRWTMWPLPLTEHGHAQIEDTWEPPKDRRAWW